MKIYAVVEIMIGSTKIIKVFENKAKALKETKALTNKCTYRIIEEVEFELDSDMEDRET